IAGRPPAGEARRAVSDISPPPAGPTSPPPLDAACPGIGQDLALVGLGDAPPRREAGRRGAEVRTNVPLSGSHSLSIISSSNPHRTPSPYPFVVSLLHPSNPSGIPHEPEPLSENTPRVHAGRAAGGARHHRHPDRPAPPRRPEGPRGRRTHDVHQ